MKTLFVMRHAKSSWDDPAMDDFDRPLNQLGLNAAPFMGELIAAKNLLPDVIVSSPAKRAMQTATLVKEHSGSNSPLIFDERIYEASPLALLAVVSELSEKYSSALIVGHNPGMEGFIRYLTGRLEPMPTAALAVIELAIDVWADVSIEIGDLTAIYRPKEEMKTSETQA